MQTKFTEIDAFVYGQKIGTLIYHQGAIYFEYDASFKKSSIEISPLKLPLARTTGVYTNPDNFYLYGGLAGVFFDSLPDKHGMAFIDTYFSKKGLKQNQITLLHKLAFIGERGMGAIEYRPKEHEDNQSVLDVLDAKDAYESMKKILNDKDEISSIESFMNIIDSVSPLGGGRPKMLITYNHETKTLKFNTKTIPHGYKRAIIKFDEIYYEKESLNFTKLEYIYMLMAKECGIIVPPIYLHEENGEHHLIIERFDRDADDEKLHIATASALMHIDISVPQSSSYEQLFALTRALCNSQLEIEQLFRRMLFNALSYNFDDHTKNFSYIMDRFGKWRLSPAYDITYSKGLATQHITTINAKGLDFTRDDFYAIAQNQSIKKSRVDAMLREILTVLESFQERAKAIGIDAKTIKECSDDMQRQRELLGFPY